MQHVAIDIWTPFQPVEDKMRDTFLLVLLKGDTYHIPWRSVTGMPFKKAGIDLP